MSLSSCATLAVPPKQYLEDCTSTYLSAEVPATNASLLKLSVDRELDVVRCNADKRALRSWVEGYCAASGKRCQK